MTTAKQARWASITGDYQHRRAAPLRGNTQALNNHSSSAQDQRVVEARVDAHAGSAFLARCPVASPSSLTRCKPDASAEK